MKTIIEIIEFPCEIKKKLKIKTSMGNLKVNFINRNIIKFNKTNLSFMELHKIIVSNKSNILVAFLYDGEHKIYLPNNNAIISLTKYISMYISIFSVMNKN